MHRQKFRIIHLYLGNYALFNYCILYWVETLVFIFWICKCLSQHISEQVSPCWTDICISKEEIAEVSLGTWSSHWVYTKIKPSVFMGNYSLFAQICKKILVKPIKLNKNRFFISLKPCLYICVSQGFFFFYQS